MVLRALNLYVMIKFYFISNFLVCVLFLLSKCHEASENMWFTPPAVYLLFVQRLIWCLMKPFHIPLSGSSEVKTLRMQSLQVFLCHSFCFLNTSQLKYWTLSFTGTSPKTEFMSHNRFGNCQSWDMTIIMWVKCDSFP